MTVKNSSLKTSFEKTPFGQHWEKIGFEKRAGVAVPLFSLYTDQSVGIGEIPDLLVLIDWCVEAGLSIIQLLPLNDTGFDFRPYDGTSSLALDPMYLSLANIKDCSTEAFLEDLEVLKSDFPCTSSQVDYGIKGEKLRILWKLFLAIKGSKNEKFEEFKKEPWLHDYALYCVAKNRFHQKSWLDWPEEMRDRDSKALQLFSGKHLEEVEFQKWLQWQLFVQLREVKEYAEEHEVLLMGDIPFLVSRDSVDVWVSPHLFKLHLASGAPPDLYFSKGQRWGMPPYDWDKIKEEGYGYFTQKLRYAENFYDLYRIDHFVGLFRVWTIPENQRSEDGGLHGSFDPSDESIWPRHGREIIDVMRRATSMLPLAEDLGTVPDCSYETLKEQGIPGLDVQRWMKSYSEDYEFKDVEEYRLNSAAVIASHDMTPFAAWWTYEAETVDRELFERKCKEQRIDFKKIQGQLFDLASSLEGRLRWKPSLKTPKDFLDVLGVSCSQAGELMDLYLSTVSEKEKFWNFLGLEGEYEENCSEQLVLEAIRCAQETKSVFAIQLIQDLLCLHECPKDPTQTRINQPAKSEGNWKYRIPLSLDRIKDLSLAEKSWTINQKAGRVAKSKG